MFSTDLSSNEILARIIAFILGVTIHEFAHAWSAYQLGDPTAQRLGRITLNPIAHFDPIGFIGMMLIAIGVPAFGWGKPVPVNPNLLRGHHRGMAITALAGPLSNVIIATTLAIPMRFGNIEPTGFVHTLIVQMIYINLFMAAFNLIPVPPLDGLKILTGFLPSFWYQFIAPMERYGFMVLFLVIFVGGAYGRELFNAMYVPIFDVLLKTIAGSGF